MMPKKTNRAKALVTGKNPAAGLGQRLSATLAGMAPRERQAVLVAIWVVGLALLW